MEKNGTCPNLQVSPLTIRDRGRLGECAWLRPPLPQPRSADSVTAATNIPNSPLSSSHPPFICADPPNATSFWSFRLPLPGLTFPALVVVVCTLWSFVLVVPSPVAFSSTVFLFRVFRTAVPHEPDASTVCDELAQPCCSARPHETGSHFPHSSLFPLPSRPPTTLSSSPPRSDSFPDHSPGSTTSALHLQPTSTDLLRQRALRAPSTPQCVWARGLHHQLLRPPATLAILTPLRTFAPPLPPSLHLRPPGLRNATSTPPERCRPLPTLAHSLMFVFFASSRGGAHYRFVCSGAGRAAEHVLCQCEVPFFGRTDACAGKHFARIPILSTVPSVSLLCTTTTANRQAKSMRRERQTHRQAYVEKNESLTPTPMSPLSSLILSVPNRWTSDVGEFGCRPTNQTLACTAPSTERARGRVDVWEQRDSRRDESDRHGCTARVPLRAAKRAMRRAAGEGGGRPLQEGGKLLSAAPARFLAAVFFNFGDRENASACSC